MMTDEQKMQVALYSGLPFDPDLCKDELLHEIFEATADRLPDKVAVDTPHASLTYRELEEQANRLARHLRKLGVGPEGKVAFQLPRTEFVYVAMLGILKAGGAYVPLDPSYPGDRISFILEDCQAKLLITTTEFFERSHAEIEKSGIQTLVVDTAAGLKLDQPSTRLSRAEIETTRENLAYIIYTSGTTGRPKGCLLEHRHICNEIRSAASVYGIVESDRVFQGFSVAFDASLEEIWMTFFNGGTLVVGTKEIMQSGAHFADMLSLFQVSVLSCVPTLLSMVEKDIPTLRIIIVGGEACPKDLIARWHRPGRVIFNSYGPTEATVIATCDRMMLNAPVTIGFAIPNYKTYILDENLALLPPSETGELCIGGSSVARGYLNRDDLNKAKFIEVETLVPGKKERLYRTGDLVRFNQFGDIEFLGRADDQVKLRGFRIELSEIESILMQCVGVLAAAVTLRQDLQQLAAYVVVREGQSIQRKAIIQKMKERLPAYMMPSWLDVVESLPMMVSGKVNRKLLPPPIAPLIDDEREIVEPRNDAEREMQSLWKELFARKDVSVKDDFFLDLGGHSLLAAKLVSHLRVLPSYEDAAMNDIYQNPSIEALVKKLTETAGVAVKAKKEPKAEFHKVSTPSYVVCGAWQVVCLPIILLLYSWLWIGPFLVFDYLTDHDMGLWAAAGISLGVYAVSMPFLPLIPLVAKWLLLGRIKAGSYPMWGSYYRRYWLVRQLAKSVPLKHIAGTPFLPFFYRLMGVKIGRNVFLGSSEISSFDLIEIGEGSSIGYESSIDGYWIENGMMHLRPVRIGAGCVVGNRSVLAPNSSMDDHSTLGELSHLTEGQRIPHTEEWKGSPAKFTGKRMPKDTPPCWSLKTSILLLLGSLALPMLAEAPVFPGLFLVCYMNWEDPLSNYVYAPPLIAVSFIIIVCVQTALLKLFILPKLREGRYPLNSVFYVRHWLFSLAFEESLDIISTVYSTLYLRYWFRILGTKLGAMTEVSTARKLQPDLLDVGPGCFLADDVMVGAPQVANGYLTVGKVHIAPKTFLGNSALIPPGSVVGSGCLIGCLSIPPGNGQTPDGSSWFGSPSIFLPNRQKVGNFEAELTFSPSRSLLIQRYAIEAIRIILPNTLFIAMAIAILEVVSELEEVSMVWAIGILPFACLAAAATAFAVILLLKWTVIGRYKPDNHPLWCNYIWRTELITGVYECFGSKFLLDLLKGTPFIAWPLRLLGMKIGRRCYIDSTWFTEMDLIKIGDDTALNEDANIQTHLFEDRVMKEGTITIGSRCSIGSKAFVLYDTEIGDDVTLEDLSIVMKGESLPGNSRWEGIPSRRIS